MKSRQTRRIPRFYIADPVHCDRQLILDKNASHHLITVLRAKPGDYVRVFNGDGHDYHAEVLEAGSRSKGRQAVLHIKDRERLSSESPLSIQLVQSVSRADRMDISVRQAVELGVTGIQPVYSRFSAKAPRDHRAEKRHEHWQSIVISAAEQSGRAIVPTLTAAMHWADWCNCRRDQAETGIILSPSAEHSLGSVLMQTMNASNPDKASRTLTLIIGPESGFDDAELALAMQCGHYPAHLGPRVLRTETAGGIAIAVTQSILGDLAAC